MWGGGRQDPFESARFSPAQRDSVYVQIHHVNGNHWVVSTSDGNGVTVSLVLLSNEIVAYRHVRIQLLGPIFWRFQEQRVLPITEVSQKRLMTQSQTLKQKRTFCDLIEYAWVLYHSRASSCKYWRTVNVRALYLHVLLQVCVLVFFVGVRLSRHYLCKHRVC